MKYIFALGLFAPFMLFAGGPHLELDLSFEESQKLWKEHKVNSKYKNLKESKTEPHIAKAIAGGETLGQWLKKINENRRSDNQLLLTSSSSRGSGIPIDKPSKYGPKTIKTRLEKILSEAPKEILEVIYNSASMPNKNPVTDEVFIEHGRKISRLYQTAVRWETTIKKWLPWYKKNQRRDVRGFYYLNKETDLNQKLGGFKNLSAEEQKSIKSHLVKLCLNDGASSEKCKKALKKSVRKNKLVKFKDKYWASAIKNWNSFWEIASPRKDVVWNSTSPNTMKVTFKDPKNETISQWLKENIEDEFKTDTWQLEFNLKKGGLGISHLKFKPGVTPHVTGGNTIVMDANSSIEEYSVKWTIRHEYGHILRLPDCYVEFYDEEEQVAVNYQLDVTDLMCSRSGDFNKRIYDELKKVYYIEK